MTDEERDHVLAELNTLLAPPIYVNLGGEVRPFIKPEYAEAIAGYTNRLRSHMLAQEEEIKRLRAEIAAMRAN